MNASQPFSESRKEIFKDQELATMYLEECLAGGDIELFKLALKHVAEARLGGIGNLSKSTKLNREILDKTLSKNENPKFDTLIKIINALGFRISVSRNLHALNS